MKISRDEALKAVDDLFNYCEEIDNSLPENEKSGYEMLPDIHKIRKYIIENERSHGECKTCKHYVPYREQFSNRPRGDGYCKSTITNAEGEAYINCHDEWYCAYYEREGEEGAKDHDNR